jgi:hypothetical protein
VKKKINIISREKIVDTFSIITRLAGFLFGVGILLVGGYVFGPQNKNIQEKNNQKDISANILLPSKLQENVKFLEENIREQNIDILQKRFQGVSGAKQFLQEAKKWKNIQDLTVNIIGRGIFVSLLASTTGDTLHPYHGYFSMRNGKDTHISWGKHGNGKIQEIKQTSEKDYFAIVIKNIGPYPWLETDIWKNKTSDEEVFLLSEEKGKTIDVGDTAILIFHDSTSFLLSNEKRKYDIFITGKD